MRAAGEGASEPQLYRNVTVTFKVAVAVTVTVTVTVSQVFLRRLSDGKMEKGTVHGQASR